MNRRHFLKAATILAAPTILPRAALGSDWPTRMVTLIVPYGAGGTIDATGRLFADHLSQVLSNRVVVENRPGAQSNAGMEFAARAAPDGYTLAVASPALGNNIAFGPKPRFEASKAFQLIGMLSTAPTVLLARPGLGVKSLPEMVALTKRKPNEITLGAGQIDHYVELLKRRSGAQYRGVSYRTSPQALTDAIAGHIDLAMALVPTALPLIGDKLVALAVSSHKRTVVLPDVPTYAEIGIQDAEVDSWFGIAAPAGTPEPIVARISNEIGVFLRNPAIREKMQTLGMEAAPETTPESFTRFAADDAARWLRIAQEFGMAAGG